MTKSTLLLAGLFALILCLIASAQNESRINTNGQCPVCRFQRMDKREKPLISHSKYKDREYRFCSDTCKTQFDINPEYYIEPPLPRPALDFALTTLNGHRDSLANYRGKIVLVEFWASWCAPCVKTMKDLQSIYTEFRADSLAIIGITLDSIGTPQTTTHLQKHQITYPILFENRTNKTWLAYQVKSLPSLYLIDRTGMIVQQWRGAAEKSEIVAAVRLLLEENLFDKQ